MLLHNLRRSLTDNAIDLAFSERKIVALAYADDLLVMATQENSFEIVRNTLNRYEKQSNANINYEKSVGLWCGAWKNRADQPLGVRWGNGQLKYLGIHIGESCHASNDAALSQKLNSCLNAYSSTLKGLSLRTRTIVLNYLVASSI